MATFREAFEERFQLARKENPSLTSHEFQQQMWDPVTKSWRFSWNDIPKAKEGSPPLSPRPIDTALGYAIYATLIGIGVCLLIWVVASEYAFPALIAFALFVALVSSLRQWWEERRQQQEVPRIPKAKEGQPGNLPGFIYKAIGVIIGGGIFLIVAEAVIYLQDSLFTFPQTFGKDVPVIGSFLHPMVHLAIPFFVSSLVISFIASSWRRWEEKKQQQEVARLIKKFTDENFPRADPEVANRPLFAAPATPEGIEAAKRLVEENPELFDSVPASYPPGSIGAAIYEIVANKKRAEGLAAGRQQKATTDAERDLTPKELELHVKALLKPIKVQGLAEPPGRALFDAPATPEDIEAAKRLINKNPELFEVEQVPYPPGSIGAAIQEIVANKKRDEGNAPQPAWPNIREAGTLTKIDDYKKYWNEFVEPDYSEYMAAIDDMRKAFHCASSLFHMADWLYWGNKTYIDANFTFKDKNNIGQAVGDEKTFANAIRDLCPDFELIRGIANAGKHLKIAKGRHAAAPVSAANTYVTSTEYGEGSYGIGPFGGTRRVRQEAPNNQDIEFTDLARAVRDMWIDLCAKHGFALVADRAIQMQRGSNVTMALPSAAKSSNTKKTMSEKLEERLRYFTYKTCDWGNKDSNVAYLTGLIILSYSLITFRLPIDWVGPAAMIATAMAAALMFGHWPSVALFLMLKFL